MSAKISEDLKRKIDELGISPSEVIRRALEEEVRRRTRELLKERLEEVSSILSKVGKEEWVKSIRETREER
ncbi:MAG: hypothetical protein DRO00_05085 [Thermoproteota archaeon]|nr:MAG: hypothetical protein DRO00_05085 [Candidatus Korarchaeota archaeon]